MCHPLAGFAINPTVVLAVNVDVAKEPVVVIMIPMGLDVTVPLPDFTTVSVYSSVPCWPTVKVCPAIVSGHVRLLVLGLAATE
jgi:hypothetical protein